MNRRALRFWCFVCAWLAVASPRLTPAADAEAPGGAGADRLEFGRVYVPADQIDQWPRGNTRYLPMDSEEFERLLAAARTATGQRPCAAAITAAEYLARLEGSRLVEGKARLDVALPGLRPSFVSLEPCGVAVDQAFWDQAKDKAAVWGLDAEVGLRAWAPQAGRLLFDWSLTGSRDPGGAIAFALALPKSPATRLILELPPDRILECDQGMVFREARAEAGPVRWRIELGGRDRVRLRVVSTGGSIGQPDVSLARQSLVYRLSERGMELSAELQLEVSRGSLRELSLTLDPGLRLVSAHLGDARLSWSAAADPRLGTTRVELRLPEPLVGSSRVIRLGALANLVMDRPWRLPGLRAEDVFWQEGNATLLVSAPLLVTQLTPLLARQSKRGALAAPSSGESLEFQYFQPDSRLEMVLAHPGRPLQVDCGAAAELGGAGIASRTIAEFRAAEGERFAIEMGLAEGWSIDSVESIPGNVLDDWTSEKVKEEPALDTAEPGGSKLIVWLTRALTPSHPVRLLIAGRCLQPPLGRELTVGDLTPLRFPPGTEGKRLVALKAAASYWLQLRGAEQLKRLDAKSLDSSQLALFAEPPRDLVFADDAGAERLRISLKAQRPRYSAAVQVDAALGQGVLAESYRLLCVPDGARMDRVLVSFCPPRPEPLQWALLDSQEASAAQRDSSRAMSARNAPGRHAPARNPHDMGSRRVSSGQPAAGLRARRLSAAEQAAAEAPPEGETWEVTLDRPSGTPFEIQATRTTPFAGTQPLCLAALPEATSQHGTLVIRESPVGAARFENRRLRPIPAAPIPPEQYHTDRATYRYDPAREMAAGAEAAVVIHSERKADAPPAAWIWNCRLDSLYNADGTGQHLATYAVQNSGRRQLELAMPPETTEVQAVWLGLAKTTWKTRESHSGKRLVIELPSEVKFPVVAVHFLTAGRRLGIAATLSPALPEADLPTLGRLATIWLPPGYEAVEPDLRWQPRQRPGLTWTQRLLGPLGRPAESRPFNPLAVEDWWSLAGYQAGRAGENPTQGNVERSLRGPVEPRLPWAAVRLGEWEPTNVFGWSAARMQLPPSAPPRLAVVHRAGIALLGWIVFLAVIGLASRRAIDRVQGLVACAGLCGVLALLVPAAYQPIASGALLAFLFCLLRPLVRGRRTAQNATRRSADTSFRVRQAAELGTGILAVMVALAIGRSASGDEARPGGASRGAADHRVLIPLDQKQEPAGATYYVSEPLYVELHRRAAAAKEPQGWLIREATYRGALAWQAAPEHVAPVQFRASFDLQVFSRAGPIRIPLGHDGVEMAPEGATLDGRAVAARWTPDGEAIALDGPEPGAYRLELALQPTLKPGAGGAGFELAIPRLAHSRLELSLPHGAPAVEVSSALGPVARSEVSSQWTAELGPTDRLKVAWQEDVLPGVGPTLDVDELLWLKIQPGSVVLDAQLCVKVVKGRLHQIRLLADPRLQLLPSEKSVSPVKEIHAGLGQPQSLRLDLAKPADDQVTVKLSFLLKDVAGVGNLRLPQLEMADGQVTRRWLALSVDPALRYGEHCGEAKPVAVPDFAHAWGTCESQPDSARDLAGASASAWSVSTSPRRPRTVAYQAVTLNYGAANVLVQLDAQMVTAAGYRFQYQLAMPQELEVDRVSVVADDVERVARWSRTPQGSLIIFLNGPVAGHHSLSLRGTMPVSLPGKTALPILRIEDCQWGSSAVALMRQPSVLLAVTNVVGLEAAELPPLDRGLASPARMVKSYVLSESPPAAADVVLAANRPRLRVEQVTVLRPKNETWEAVEEVDVAVSEGVLDNLSLEVPSRFAGPYEIDPPATLKVLDTPGRPRRLLIRPRAEVKDHCRFRILGALSTGPGEPVSAPSILVEQAGQARHLVVLPSKRDGRTVQWETQGLKPVAMPKDWTAPLPADSSPVVYEATAKDYQAVLETPDRQGGAPRCRLADIHLAWQADGSCHGTASFDLDPAGRAACPLHFPAGLKPIQVFVAGAPVTPLPDAAASPSRSDDEDNHAAEHSAAYALPLCSKALPQRIEVVFAGKLPAPPSGKRLRFDAPHLGPIPVERTLWTIDGPPLYQPQSAAGATRTNEARQELLRLTSILQLVEPVSTATTEEPETLDHWYADWAAHLDASRGRLQRLLGPAGADKRAENALREIEARQTRIADLLWAAHPSQGNAAPTPLATAPSELWQSTLLQPGETVTYLAAGASSLTVDYTRVEAGGIVARLLGAAAVGAGTVLVVLALRRGMLPGPLGRRPRLCGVAAGLAWWLWLAPSILGWLIVAASVLSGFRPRRRTLRPRDSVIVPLIQSK